jgi:hypothetical protein
MSSITPILQTIATYVDRGFAELPRAIGVSTMFLGLSMMNLSYIFFSLGIALFAPLIIFLIKNLIGGRLTFLDMSYWPTLMVFICTYIIINAGYLIKVSPDGSAPDYMVQSRRSQAVFAMLYALAFIIVTWWYNHNVRGEIEIGKILTSIFFGSGLAIGWHFIITTCGITKLTDIFGITSRLFHKPATSEQSTTICYSIE